MDILGVISALMTVSPLYLNLKDGPLAFLSLTSLVGHSLVAGMLNPAEQEELANILRQSEEDEVPVKKQICKCTY